MSEVIVRMEMPLNCAVCRCHTDGWCYMLSIQPSECAYDSSPSWCPIIGELPEQHGRLVDAKHFEVVSYTENEVEQAGYCWRSFDDGVEWLLNKVDATPTIVPATERRR